jgi:hypothetical protein
MAEAKQRHWSLTAWLIVMIIANSIVVLSGLITFILGYPPLPPPVARRVLTLALVTTCFSIANVVFSIALFRWKKWGFFGLVGTSVLVMVIGLTIGKHISRVLLPVPWIVILYVLLQTGKEKTGWAQLE